MVGIDVAPGVGVGADTGMGVGVASAGKGGVGTGVEKVAGVGVWGSALMMRGGDRVGERVGEGSGIAVRGTRISFVAASVESAGQ